MTIYWMSLTISLSTVITTPTTPMTPTSLSPLAALRIIKYRTSNFVSWMLSWSPWIRWFLLITMHWHKLIPCHNLSKRLLLPPFIASRIGSKPTLIPIKIFRSGLPIHLMNNREWYLTPLVQICICHLVDIPHILLTLHVLISILIPHSHWSFCLVWLLFVVITNVIIYLVINGLNNIAISITGWLSHSNIWHLGQYLLWLHLDVADGTMCVGLVCYWVKGDSWFVSFTGFLELVLCTH